MCKPPGIAVHCDISRPQLTSRYAATALCCSAPCYSTQSFDMACTRFSSAVAIDARWTSSGPSARRSVRACAHRGSLAATRHSTRTVTACEREIDPHESRPGAHVSVEVRQRRVCGNPCASVHLRAAHNAIRCIFSVLSWIRAAHRRKATARHQRTSSPSSSS